MFQLLGKQWSMCLKVTKKRDFQLLSLQVMVQHIWDNWLSVLRLDWKQIKQISLEPVDKVEKLVSKYAALFDRSLGTIKGVTAHLKLEENTNPQFFKPQLVRFVVKEKLQKSSRGWKESVCW